MDLDWWNLRNNLIREIDMKLILWKSKEDSLPLSKMGYGIQVLNFM